MHSIIELYPTESGDGYQYRVEIFDRDEKATQLTQLFVCPAKFADPVKALNAANERLKQRLYDGWKVFTCE